MHPRRAIDSTDRRQNRLYQFSQANFTPNYTLRLYNCKDVQQTDRDSTVSFLPVAIALPDVAGIVAD